MNKSPESDVRCALCKAQVLQRLYAGIERDGQSYDVYRCPECGLGMTWPFPDKERLERMYAPGKYRAHERRFIYPLEWLVRKFRDGRLRRLKKYCKRGRMLDIGCGRGLILSMARAEGWEVCGLEFNDKTASHVRDVLGLDVRVGRLEDAGFRDGDFDAVTIWHVLEHMEDPVGTIRECYRVLKPGGLLLVSLPNLRSLQSVMSGRHWFHLDVPYHLYHFNVESLGRLLDMHSFRVMEVDHFSFEFNPFGFLQSLLDMTGVRHNLLYDVLKTGNLKAAEDDAGHYLNLMATVSLMPLYVPLSLALSALEPLLGMGGTIDVYARKEQR